MTSSPASTATRHDTAPTAACRTEQSPWLDNLPRQYLRDGTLAHLVRAGVRGVTANPKILAKAIEGSDAYDAQLVQLITEGRPVADAYWELVIDDVIEAYLTGLEALAASGGDLGAVRSVASFFVSRVDTEVDGRLDAIGTPDATALRGQVAVAQATLTYQLFSDHFAGPRWECLAALGAHVQRLLWASHGTVARTVDTAADAAAALLDRLATVGIDLNDVGRVLEDHGVSAFHESFQHVLGVLELKAQALRGARSGLEAGEQIRVGIGAVGTHEHAT